MSEKKDALYRWLLLAVCAACAGVSVFMVWNARFTLDPDAGVVALMARHMAEGTDFPVFFYGQPYMGSLEPAVSALFFLIFGASELALCMGTALIGLCVLPVVYFWARDAAGRWAGLAALAFLAIGPAGYFPYMSVPRGGYALIVLSAALVLWLSVRILSREWMRESADWRLYAALGLAAGAGWWTSALASASLATAGLLFLCIMRRRLASWRVLIAGLAFFAGSAPFWIWNIRHDWASFVYYAGGAHHAPFLANLVTWLPARFLLLMGLEKVPGWRAAPVLVLLGVALLSGLMLLFRSLRSGNRRAALPLTAAALFMLVSLLLFCDSNFARLRTPRYLAPLVPALAVVIGAGTVWLHDRIRRLAVIPLLALVLLQAGELKVVRARAESQRVRRDSLAAFAGQVRAAGHDVVYRGFSDYWLNFMSRETVCFTPLDGERYGPSFERAEKTDTPAVAGNYGYVREFLFCSGGTAQCDNVFYGFRPPAMAERPIARDRIAGITAPGGEDVLDQLTDGSFDTFVERPFQDKPPAEECFVVSFRASTEVCGFRLLNRSSMYPAKMRVEGRASAGADWVILKNDVVVPKFCWSGPRPFWGGRFRRIECRFEPALVSEVRISFLRTDPRAIWRFAELDMQEPGPPSSPESEALPGLLESLKTAGVGRLYCSRWIAIKVRDALGGGMTTEMMETAAPVAGRRHVNNMSLSESAGILVRSEDAALTRRALARRRVNMAEIPTGPWVLFHFGPGQWDPAYSMDHGLYWTGYACLTYRDWMWAWALFRRAESDFAASGNVDRAIADAHEVLAICPHWQPVMSWLAGCLKGAGRREEARQWEEKAGRIWLPDTLAAIRFANGVELAGVSMVDGPFQPGSSVGIRYFFRCPSDYPPHSRSVFVHFRHRGNVVFQDDHVLLEKHDTGFQPFPMTFVEERSVRIPSNAPPGAYEIGLGLYDPRAAMSRTAMNTSLPASRRMAILPVRLEISAAQAGASAAGAECCTETILPTTE